MKITSLQAKLALISLASLASTQVTRASLAVDYQFNGKGNWSLDAVGSDNTPVGDIQAVVPVGSTVVKAFLYSSISAGGTLNSVDFDGTTINNASFTNLGSNPVGLHAYRVDVTSQVAAKVGSGNASPYTFTINSEDSNIGIDGEALAIVYSNPGESQRTIAFLDGSSASDGDSFKVNLATPLIDPTTPGFEALMSLGIGYSYQGNGVQQFSNVNVDGRALTSAAGGDDDGAAVNGGLITVGGLGDDPANPVDPTAIPTNDRSDDELYNLALGNGANPAPFLSAGATSFTVNTDNPSHDDNIFFAGINITAEAGVNAPPPPPSNPGAVPEPSTYGLIGASALLGLVIRRKFKKA